MLQTPISYRADIDGLRAFAVLSVLVFHALPTALPGGFIGVDVFFVISGFLISSIVFKEAEKKEFSLAYFYERRMRRILPALVVVIVATLAGGLVVLGPVDLVRLARSATASMAFVSNFYFAKQLGYFAPSSEMQPLLHTWSLSVEEQFYVVAPMLLAALAGPWRRWRPHLIAFFFLLSLGAALYAVHAESMRAFFQPHLRAYEFLVGVSLAAAGRGVPRGWLREALGLLGLAMFGASLAILDGDTPFPGGWALLPSVAAGLLIVSSDAERPSVVGRLLSSFPLVSIGRISYSLYLWHWPILAFARYSTGGEPSLSVRLSCLALTLVLSVATYALVETPWRRRKIAPKRKSVFQSGLAATIVLIGVSEMMVAAKGLPQRLSPEAAALARDIEADRSAPKMCGFRSNEREQAEACVIGAPEARKRSFVVWGDSHAGALGAALDEEAAKVGQQGYFVGRAGCAPLLAVETLAKEPPRCHAGVGAFRKALADPDVREVVLVARWAMYAEGSAAGTRPRPFVKGDLQKNRAVFADYLEQTVERIREQGKLVSVIGPVPELDVDPAMTVMNAAMRGRSPEVSMPRAIFDERQAGTNAALARIEKIEGVRVLYPQRTLCTQEVCHGSRDGRSLYIDDNHLGARGADLMRPLIRDVLDASK